MQQAVIGRSGDALNYQKFAIILKIATYSIPNHVYNMIKGLAAYTTICCNKGSSVFHGGDPIRHSKQPFRRVSFEFDDHRFSPKENS
jgi:hypothetical protein